MYLFLYVLLSALAFLIPTSANAANLFEPASGSLAVMVVDAMFGKINGAGTDAFSGVMLLFNGGVLIIGGLLFAYTILAGTMMTAHDGEALGKKFSSVWIPIRYGLGTILIIPIVNGYCLMQFIVYWLIIQGIGLGDQVWASYVSKDNIAQSVSAGITRPDTKKFTYQLLETLTCQEVISRTFKDVQLLDGGSSFGMTKSVGLLSTKYSWGDKNNLSGFNYDSCGSITIKDFSLPATATSGSTINFLFKIGDGIQRMKEINKEHQNQVAILLFKLQPYASKISKGEVIDIKEINNLADAYEESVRLKAAEQITQMDSFKNFSENASRNGFFPAGAWYMPLSFMADMVQRSVADVPTATGPTTMNTFIAKDEWMAAQHILQETLKRTDAVITTSTTFGVSSGSGADKGWWDTIKDTVMSGLDVTKLVDKAFSSSTEFMIGDNENPIMAMKRMGNWLFGIASAAYITLSTATATIGNAPGVGDVLSIATVMFVTPILIAGFLLSYVFPMMPFFIWIGAITGYILLCVEAIIAAPLWACMHLTPHGDDLTGSGGNGYRLVLSLLLRPVLMVFGLIAALTMTQVMGDVLNKLYAGVFLLSQTDSGLLVKIFGCFVAGPIIYGGMMFTFTKKMFDVITHLPDELLNWIGGGGPQLGGFASDMGGQNSHTYAMAGIVGRAAGQSAEGMKNNKLLGGDDHMKETPGSMNEDVKNSASRLGAAQTAMGMNDKKPGAGSAGGGSDGSGDAPMSYSEQNQAQQERMQEETQANIQDQFSNVEETFGGEESPNYESFRKDLEKRIEDNPNVPVLVNMNSAFNRELNKTYGKEAGGNLKEISGGSYSGADFKESVGKYQDTQTALDNAGFSEKETKEAIEGASLSAKKEYLEHKEDGGTKNLKEFLIPQLDKINPDLNTTTRA